MGRPVKQGVDWFKHDTRTDGKTLYTLEAMYRNDGYAFWFKLLEIVGTQEKLYYDCRNEPEWMYLVAKTGVTDNMAKEILGLLSALKAIDADLWKNHKIIWIQNLVNRVSEIYTRRGTEVPQKPVIDTETTEKPQLNRSNRIDNNSSTALIESESTQSRVEKRRVEKSREENNAHAREGDIFADRSFSPQIKGKLTEWLKYKTEKRDGYKPTGLIAFLSTVENKLKEHSETDVIWIIEESMSNNWKGIAWDKIKSRASPQENSNPFLRGKV